MENDILLYGLIISAFLYVSGYASAAVLIGGGLAAIYAASVLMASMQKKHPAPKGGSQLLEPIVIETTRLPPYRIPAKMDIRMHPQWGMKTFYEKASYKTLGGAAKAIRKLFG